MTTDTDDDDIDRNNRSKMVARWGGWLHARWACQGNKVKASTVLANDLGLNPKSRHGCILAELMHRGPRAKWLRSHTMDAARAANFYLDHDTYLDHALSLRLRGSRSELPDFVLGMPYNGALGTNDPDDRDRLPRNMAGLTAQCFDHGIAFRIIACAHYNNEVVGLLFFRADNEPALVAMENSPGYIKPLELLRAHVPGQLLSADGRVR